MNKFVFEIPNERAAVYRLITIIVLALNFFVFGVVLMKATDRSAQVVAVAALFVTGVPSIYYLLNKKHLRTPLLDVCFLLSAFLWVLCGNYWAAILVELFSLFGFFANKKMLVIFSEEGIRYPSFPVKNYTWREVSQVLLKDDILTIDLRNNKLMQVNLSKTFTPTFDVARFNEFCRAKI